MAHKESADLKFHHSFIANVVFKSVKFLMPRPPSWVGKRHFHRAIQWNLFIFFDSSFKWPFVNQSTINWRVDFLFTLSSDHQGRIQNFRKEWANVKGTCENLSERVWSWRLMRILLLQVLKITNISLLIFFEQKIIRFF